MCKRYLLLLVAVPMLGLAGAAQAADPSEGLGGDHGRQNAIVGGRRVQPTQRDVQERLEQKRQHDQQQHTGARPKPTTDSGRQ